MSDTELRIRFSDRWTGNGGAFGMGRAIAHLRLNFSDQSSGLIWRALFSLNHALDNAQMRKQIASSAPEPISLKKVLGKV